MAPAIWPVATWATGRSREVGDLLEDALPGYVYGRYDNPTNTALHAVVASLHDAENAWSAASGTAAIHSTLEVLRDGGRILASAQLYGGTWALLRRLEREAGWRVDYTPVSDADMVAAALTDDHTVLYVETIANPALTVPDLAALAGVCRQREVALVVDNTFASPVLCRPLALGATAVVESATKYLGGHGDVVGGVVAADAGTIAAVRKHVYEVGASLGPFEAWLVARGIQTLPLRIERAAGSALQIANLLAGATAVQVVRYPGLHDDPHHDVATRQFGGAGYGGMVSFDLDDRDSAEAFADACEVFVRAASLGGTHSLVLHPASTTHRQLDADALAAAGLGPGTLRLSVGIEDATDLLADVDRALRVAASN